MSTVAVPVTAAGHTNGSSGLYKANNCTIVLVILDLASSVYTWPPIFKEKGQVLSEI